MYIGSLCGCCIALLFFVEVLCPTGIQAFVAPEAMATFNETLNVTSGYIKSPNYAVSDYPTDYEYSWLIESQGNNYVTEIVMDFIDIEWSVDCANDVVEVLECTEGAGEAVLAMYCGTTRGSPITTSLAGSDVIVIFKSDATVTDVGFKLRFHFINQANAGTPTAGVDACNGQPRLETLSNEGDSVKIYSPGWVADTDNSYTSVYSNNLDCRWLIAPGATLHLEVVVVAVRLEDQPYCVSDYVDIRKGVAGELGDRLNRTCGTVDSFSLTVMDSMYVKFMSDSQTTGAGFAMEITAEGYV